MFFMAIYGKLSSYPYIDPFLSGAMLNKFSMGMTCEKKNHVALPIA